MEKGDWDGGGMRDRRGTFPAAGGTNSALFGMSSALFCTSSALFCTFSASCLGKNRVFGLETGCPKREKGRREGFFRPNSLSGKEIGGTNGIYAILDENDERPVGWLR